MPPDEIRRFDGIDNKYLTSPAEARLSMCTCNTGCFLFLLGIHLKPAKAAVFSLLRPCAHAFLNPAQSHETVPFACILYYQIIFSVLCNNIKIKLSERERNVPDVIYVESIY
jgi:hypothetical protein